MLLAVVLDLLVLSSRRCSRPGRGRGAHDASPSPPSGEFGDAIALHLHHEREPRGGAEVGGSHYLPLLWEHLKAHVRRDGPRVVIALPLGLVLGHTGGLVPRRSRRRTSAAPCRPRSALLRCSSPYLGPGFLNVTLALDAAGDPADPHQHLRRRAPIDRDAVDAARGMGLTGAQIIRQVELPLALPLIFGGIQTSTVNVIATATIAPLAGVVTLGDPIVNRRGYGARAGSARAIVVAALAIAAEVGLRPSSAP